jgi:hypothetical protein
MHVQVALREAASRVSVFFIFDAELTGLAFFQFGARAVVRALSRLAGRACARGQRHAKRGAALV